MKPGEIAELVRVCCDDPTPAGARDAALFTLAIVSGARRSEIAYLMMEDYVEPPVLFSAAPPVQREAQHPPTMLTLRVIGKRNKERKIYLHSGALDAMMDWLFVRGDDAGSIFCAINKSGKVFTDRIITTTALDYILKKRMLQAGIAPMTWHDFRRTTAGNLLDAGVDISTAAGILGHSNVETTARYDRRGDRARIKASNKLTVPYFGRPGQ